MVANTTKTDIALLQKDVQYIKESILGMSNTMEKFIESAEQNFATKVELEPIKNKQKDHDEIISRIAWAVFWGFIAIIGGIIGITKFM